ncbi:MAG: insulinase family protein [Hyphomicrobiales bacterium]|nr:insulinase family protein [Hyphomicrobiales bacterium]
MTLAAPRRAALAAVLLALLAPPAFAAETPPASPPPSAATAATETPKIGANVSTFQLPNGLTVVVIPDHRAAVVTHMVWYKAGSADEPPGKSGIAHYLEHLMFKGTKANPGGAFSKKVAEIGGQENAFTSWDYTAYYQRVAKEHLGLVMGLEADRMQNLQFDPATAAPELKVVLEERSMRTDNEPSARLGEAVDAALHPNHPYRIPVIGWRSEIEKLTAQDAKAFYDRFYTPNNAVLVVAGDVDEVAVRDLALSNYGRVQKRADPGKRMRPQDPEIDVVQSVRLADERVAQPSWRRLWRVPSSHTAEPGVSEALELLADTLGGGSTSRLYRSLVVEKGLAAQVGVSYQSDALDDGRFLIYAVPRDGVDFDKLSAAIDAEIAAVVRDGAPAEEIARSKTKVYAEAIKVQDNQASLARIFGTEMATGGEIERVRDWPARIRAVTPDQVKAAATRWLRPEGSVTGELVSAPPSGKPLTRGGATLGAPMSGPIRHGEAPAGFEPLETTLK